MTTRSDKQAAIPLSIPQLSGREWKYVKLCLDTNWVSTAGPFVSRFEKAMRHFTGARHAVSTVSGTAALHAALLASGISPGDEVLVSDLTFIAPANAIRYVGAWPVFMDVEPVHWQMDTEKLIRFAEKECRWTRGALVNKRTGRRVKGILPVHVLGHPVDMDPVMRLARKYGLRVIEDASESLGAEYKGQKTGCIGDAGCFSFNGNKIITTGGGGMILTNGARLAEKARYLTTQAKDDKTEYIHKQIGYNYRMTNIPAAMGCAQMEQLGAFVSAKRRIARAYAGALKGVPGVLPMTEAKWAKCTFWLYTVLIDEKRYGMSSRVLMKKLKARGIQTRPLWQPLHLSAAHTHSRHGVSYVSEQISRRALCLPSSTNLSARDIGRVTALIGELGR